MKQSRKTKRFLALLAVLLGSLLGGRGRRFLLNLLPDFEIAKDAQIGFTLLDCESVEIASGCKVGHFTVIRNLHKLSLSSDARIGTFNWIYGNGCAVNGQGSRLIMHEGASVTSRHLIDCTADVTLGKNSIIAGYRSQLLTHSIDIRQSRQTSAPISIGEYSFIGTNSVLLKGSQFPDRSVLAAGSVFRGEPSNTLTLYAGVPARAVKEYSAEFKFFFREVSHVD